MVAGEVGGIVTTETEPASPDGNKVGKKESGQHMFRRGVSCESCVVVFLVVVVPRAAVVADTGWSTLRLRSMSWSSTA